MKKHHNSVILFSSALLTFAFMFNIMPLHQKQNYGKIIIEKNNIQITEIYNMSFEQMLSENDDFIFPINGTVTSPFNDTKDRENAHKGIDIAADIGTEVKSAADGIVENACYSQTYGWYISVINGNTKTIYAHNHKLMANKGDKVSQGDVIALSGNSGNSTGPHLHFEIIIDGIYADPLELCK